ncbi:MAG TPA: CHAT domain-containing protein [Bryobacteraceae bacterium]|nr:CHAT domain-containing protein [Bryobacteraceae bacterium]
MRAALLLPLLLVGCARQTPDSLYRSSQTLLKQGKLAGAVAAADAGLHLDPSWRFRLLKAEALLSMGEGKKAMDTLHSAPPPSAPEDRARVAMHEGYANFVLANYPAAAASLDQAREIARPLNLPLLDAQIALRRGALEVQLGHVDLAESMFRGALATAVAQDDLSLQATAIGNLGYLLLNTFRYDQAIYWFERAQEAFERLGAASSIPRALGNLGSCYDHLGEYDRALDYLQNAESGAQKIGNRFEAQVWLGNIGNVLLDKGDDPAAAAKFAAALKIARDYGDLWTGTWLINLAIASINLRDFDSAERYNNEASSKEKSLSPEFKGYIQINRARILAGRNEPAAAEALFHAIIAQPSSDPAEAIDAESGLAELLVSTGDHIHADAQFRSALALVEHQQSTLARDEYKLSYFSSLIRLYQDYVDFLVTTGQNARALEIVESSRARVLDEKLQSAGKSERSVTATALEQVARPSNSVLLSYWLAPQRSFLWIVTRDGLALHILPSARKIDALVEAYGSLLENLRDPLQSESPAGRELSEILLGPVRPLLNQNARLILVPDQSLHSLNFETLPDPDNPSRYLIERATVAVAPSLGVLTSPRAPQPSGSTAEKSILLIGDPDSAIEEYPRLPFASKEISLIEQSFPPQSSLVIEGARANPAAYRDNDPARFRFIHFAAHASANRENPLDSALILSRNASGYALSARDVMNLPLHADLVTLSACRSAGARQYSGEGLVGLSWAFLRAGAANVVAGLWDVNDLSTADLMAGFYADLAHGSTPSAALRDAKLRLLHTAGAYRKPFYWGPFQLYVGRLN